MINELARKTDSGGSAEGEALIAVSTETDPSETRQRIQVVAVQGDSQLRIDGFAVEPITVIAISKPTLKQEEVSHSDESTRAVDQLLADDSLVALLLH